MHLIDTSTNVRRALHARSVAAAVAARCGTLRARTHDASMTYDQMVIDSAGVFLVGELERLDPTLNAPLVDVTWGRDIELREDVGMGDEAASFTNSFFAAAGGPSPGGKSWVGKDATAIQGVALDIAKTSQPLYLWATELAWTIPELASAQRLNRPIESDKHEALQLKWNMDTDEQVYVGDSVLGVTGLLNHSDVTVSNAMTGSWATATEKQILNDINECLTSAWQASGFSICPDKLMLPPMKFAYLGQTPSSALSAMSLLTYLQTNCIAMQQNGRPLEIVPVKWLTTAGVGGSNRMMAYTNKKRFVRFPMVPLQRTPLEYRGLRQLSTFFGRLGQVEFVYPETAIYRDGI